MPILRGNRLRMYTLHHSLFEVKYRSAFRLLDSIISLCCYRAALYATRSFLWQRCLSVRPPVRLSVTRVNCDKTNESSADILTPHERKIHAVFLDPAPRSNRLPIFIIYRSNDVFPRKVLPFWCIRTLVTSSREIAPKPPKWAGIGNFKP